MEVTRGPLSRRTHFFDVRFLASEFLADHSSFPPEGARLGAPTFRRCAPRERGDCAAIARTWLTSYADKRRARTSERSPDTGPSWPELSRKQFLPRNRGRGNVLCETKQTARARRRRGSRDSRQEPRRFRLAERGDGSREGRSLPDSLPFDSEHPAVCHET
jgi:hypothetical protein